MIHTKVYGIHGEGRILCRSCAERLYGNSLEMYLSARDIQGFSESDRPTYARQGLLCDDCSSWIFQPDRTEDPWWRLEPGPEEHLRLLAPFANFLETLQIDAMNLRNFAASRA
jgi:hypothetical protein